jgi:hypothetical protein
MDGRMDRGMDGRTDGFCCYCGCHKTLFKTRTHVLPFVVSNKYGVLIFVP